MALPSREELVAVLRAQQGSSNFEDECPVCKDKPSDVEVSCRHTFCLDCLESCLTTDNRCPLCRTELCHRDDENTPLVQAAPIYPWIERLDLDFEIDDNIVNELMFERIMSETAHYLQIPMTDGGATVSVDYPHLISWAVAYMTCLKLDAAMMRSTFEDVAREEWNLVARSVQMTLLSLHGEELESGQLWDMLDRNIYRAARQQGLRGLKYADKFGGTWRFLEGLFKSLDGIVLEARRFHLGRPMPPIAEAVEWPERVSPIDFPFDIDTADVIRALEQLNGQRAGKFNLRGMHAPELYINCRRFIPFMVAAVYVHKPLYQPPDDPDRSRYRDSFCHDVWTLAAWKLSDCLEDLHGQKLSPDELEQTLVWSLEDLPSWEYGSREDLPSWEYGSRYTGLSSFSDDLESMLHTFMHWVFRLNQFQPPKPMETQPPQSGPIQSNVPRYIRALMSAGESDKDDEDDDQGGSAVDNAWSAWSAIDSRSRIYLEELW